MIEVENNKEQDIELWNMVAINPKRWKPWFTVFYVDCPQYLSFNAFDKYGVRPFWMSFHETDEHKYVGIICRVWKRQFEEFLECMNEMQRTMIICGDNDYEDLPETEKQAGRGRVR
mgnify:CR=1 FL=1